MEESAFAVPEPTSADEQVAEPGFVDEAAPVAVSPDSEAIADNSEGAGVEDVTPGAEAMDTAPEPPRCWWVGPVSNDQLSEELSARFAEASISMDLVLRTVEADPDHWVFLATSGSQADVRDLSRHLRDVGYDNFPITTGPLAGSLSLGLFRSGEGARELRGELQAAGYAAEIYQRPRYRDEAWVELDDAGRQAMGWPADTGPVEGFEGLLLEEGSCSR